MPAAKKASAKTAAPAKKAPSKSGAPKLVMESPKAPRYAKQRKFMQAEDARGRNVGQEFVGDMRNGQSYGRPEWFVKGDKPAGKRKKAKKR